MGSGCSADGLIILNSRGANIMKKIISIIMVIALFSLTACGSGSSANSGGNTAGGAANDIEYPKSLVI